MNGFPLILRSTDREQQINGVTAFVGEDSTGSFGLMANHARFMTALEFGLARFRVGGDDWQYLAVPGAVVYFSGNRLTLNTRRYVIDRDFDRIRVALQRDLLNEERALRRVRTSLRSLEENLLRRLWQVGRETRIPE